MGWFRRKRDARDANDVLREYNEAEAARLRGLTVGSASPERAPATIVSGSGIPSGEMSVEDVFTITGRGLVATGKVTAGAIRVGDAVAIVRHGADTAQTEITGIEMFGRRATEAAVGEMVGVILRGRNDVARGDLLRVTASA